MSRVGPSWPPSAALTPGSFRALSCAATLGLGGVQVGDKLETSWGKRVGMRQIRCSGAERLGLGTTLRPSQRGAAFGVFGGAYLGVLRAGVVAGVVAGVAAGVAAGVMAGFFAVLASGPAAAETLREALAAAYKFKPRPDAG